MKTIRSLQKQHIKLGVGSFTFVIRLRFRKLWALSTPISGPEKEFHSRFTSINNSLEFSRRESSEAEFNMATKRTERSDMRKPPILLCMLCVRYCNHPCIVLRCYDVVLCSYRIQTVYKCGGLFGISLRATCILLFEKIHYQFF